MAPGILIEDLPHELAVTPTSTVNKSSIPFSEWPRQLTGKLCWSGFDFASDNEYTLHLTQTEVDEINSALEAFKELELDGNDVNQDNFPLPSLRPKLLESALELHSGKGFVNIRGLNPAQYTPEDNIVIFLGVSSYLGTIRGKQDEDGNMLMHISDSKESATPSQSRPTRYSNRASTFHTDTFCDILALQTRSNAAVGGKHSLASSWTLYNRLAMTRPDVIRTLASAQWHFDSRSKLLASNRRPLLFYLDQRVIMNFAQEPLKGLSDVSRAAGIPALTREQVEALDMVQSLATDTQLTLDMQPGDLTFINNHSLLHTREQFMDTPDATRYIVRLWLKNEALAWKLPRELKQGNDRLYKCNELDEVWNVVPVPKIDFKLSERLCS